LCLHDALPISGRKMIGGDAQSVDQVRNGTLDLLLKLSDRSFRRVNLRLEALFRGGTRPGAPDQEPKSGSNGAAKDKSEQAAAYGSNRRARCNLLLLALQVAQKLLPLANVLSEVFVTAERLSNAKNISSRIRKLRQTPLELGTSSTDQIDEQVYCESDGIANDAADVKTKAPSRLPSQIPDQRGEAFIHVRKTRCEPFESSR